MGMLMMVAIAAASACGGRTSTSPLQKLMPAGSAIAPDALGFLAELPASTSVFGVLDLHQPLQLTVDRIVANAPWLGPLVTDLKAMAERRLGLNPLSSRAFGFAGIEISGDPGVAQKAIDVKVADDEGNSEQTDTPRQKKMEMFGVFQATGNPTAAFAPVAAIPGAFRSADVVLYKLGAYWAVGNFAAITALDAARKLPARFLATKTEFIRWAWAKAGGEFLMAIEAPASAKDDKGVAGSLGRAVVTAQSKTDGAVQRYELRVHLQGRPGQHPAMQTEVLTFVDQARAQLAIMLAELQRAQPALAALAQHYVTAMDKSLIVTPGQDETVIALSGRMPTLPPFAAAPSMQNRVAAQGEAAVVQFNAGGPLLDAFVAATDVFAQPLDRAAVIADVLKLLPPGAPVGTSSIVASMGGSASFVFSATTAISGQLQNQALPWGASSVETKVMPWGVALSFGGAASSDQAMMLDPRLDKPSATAILRGALDVSKLPAPLQAQVGGLVRSAFFEVGMSRALVEIQAVKGQGQALMGLWELGKKQMWSQVEPMYAQRTSFEDPSQELGAILTYHWTKLIVTAIAPKLVGDDLLRLDLEMNNSAVSLSGGVVIGTAMAGVLAAVAIPAFMDYLKKARQSEAQLMLNKIMKSQKNAFLTDASYIVGTSALVPAMSCCQVDTDGKKQCAGNEPQWQQPVWQAIDFAIDEPHYFRYSIESTASGYIAKAVGDLDCDGIEVTYELVGSTQAGNPTATLTAPPKNTD